MPANKEGKAIRQAKVAEMKLGEGKTCREIAKEIGTSPMTVSRDMNELIQDGTIRDQMEWIKKSSARMVVKGMDVEEEFIEQTKGKEEKPHQDVAVVSGITEKAQKRYSFLQGALSDQEGGDTAPETFTKDELIRIAYGKDDSRKSAGGTSEKGTS